jgi:hypothetical protein
MFFSDMSVCCLAPNLFGVLLSMYKTEAEYFNFWVKPGLLGRDICVRCCSASRPNVIPVQATETCRRNRVLMEGCRSLTPRLLYMWGKLQVPVFSRVVGLRGGLVIFWETYPTHAGNRTPGLSADSLLWCLHTISCSVTTLSWSTCVSFCLYLLDYN